MSEAISSNSSAAKSSSDLPPARDRKGIRSVSPPLSGTPLHRFNYSIVLFGVLILSFYAWRWVQWKNDAGGWWNMALGRRSPAGADALNPNPTGASYGGANEREKGEPTVEDRINELAAALGMPSSDLAAVIADAVREHVPPASLSSVAAHEPSGSAVQYLVNPSAAAEQEAASGVTGKMQAVANAVEAAVGLDEPPTEMYST